MGVLTGSAYKMVRDIADGFVTVTERTFKTYGAREIGDFTLEADRLLREVRAEQPPGDDANALQKKQRRMQRIQQALTIVQVVRQKQR